jgi:tRNA(fMet)-specific endonuclease VapC
MFQILGQASDTEVMLSTITVSELLIGAFRATRPSIRAQRESFIQDLIDRLNILPVDLEVARVHARLGTQLASVGISIGAHDLLIGATAIAHNAGIVTDNLRDFERIPGLQVFRPEW